MKTSGMLRAIGLGAGLMYIFDPDKGKRRRAMLRDKAVHYYKSAQHGLNVTALDVSNRAHGMLAESKSILHKEQPSDDVLVERIRAKMGRIVSHPSSIEVHAVDGKVTLGGVILKQELHDLLSTVYKTRGTKEVDNQLQVHDSPEDVPGLQGEPAPRGGHFELTQVNWSPAARALVGTSGGLATFYGFRRGGFFGTLLATAGAGMIARAATNMEIKRLLGKGVGPRSIEIHKTINIDAPIDEVFRFWTNYENFPRFMANITEVKDLSKGRSHWTARGPSSIPVTWDAMITSLEPNKIMSWKSVPGSTVENAGIIHFSTNPDGSTKADIKISYNPPAGAVGHAVAALFKSDLKTQMDEDLARMKTLIETERAPREQVTAGGA